MKTAFIVIDVQNDFCKNGALAVDQADSVVPVINRMLIDYEIVCLTQDWHPTGHSSFASSYENKSPFDLIEVSYGKQVLWPDHCVQGSVGADFHNALNTNLADMIVRKGFNPAIDSYSAFFENDKRTPTGLHGYLQTRQVEKIDLVGLAMDFCVAYSALDAAKLDYKVRVIEKATRAIDLDGSLQTARENMAAAGVVLEI